MRKILVVSGAAALGLAVPTLAAATGDGSHASPCVPTTTTTTTAATTPTDPSIRTTCPPGTTKPPQPSKPEQGKPDQGKPSVSAGFVNRIWRIRGLANGYEAGVLDFTASRFARVPKRFRDDDDAFVGVDSRVIVTAKTRVYDEDGDRVTGTTRDAALDLADTVVVIGKVRPKPKWQRDEDDVPVPTLNAKRIKIVG